MVHAVKPAQPECNDGAHQWHQPAAYHAFPVENAIDLTASGNAAFNTIGANFAGQNSHMFLWGLPFFYGRNVYTVIGNAKIGKLTGPFVAF